MSAPLAMIGAAMLEVIGLNPQGIDEDGEATIAELAVFDDDPFLQATANGAEKFTLKLACRPHVMGGLDAYEILKTQRRAREPVPYLRMYGFSAEFEGLVYIRRMSRSETKIAPSGMGWRHEFSDELIKLGRNSEGGF